MMVANLLLALCLMISATTAEKLLALSPSFLLRYSARGSSNQPPASPLLFLTDILCIEQVSKTHFQARLSVEYGEPVWASIGFSTDGNMASTSLFVVGVPDQGVGIYDRDVNNPSYPENLAHSKPVERADQSAITRSSFYWDQAEETSFYDFDLRLDAIPSNAHELVFAHGNAREFQPPHIVKSTYGKIDLDTVTATLSPGFTLDYTAKGGTFKGALKLQQGNTWASIGFTSEATMKSCELFVVGSAEGVGLYEKDCSKNEACHTMPTKLADQSALSYTNAAYNSQESVYSFTIEGWALPKHANQLIFAHAGEDSIEFAPGHIVKESYGEIDLSDLETNYVCSPDPDECNVCQECCSLYTTEDEVCGKCVREECNVCQPELGCTFSEEFREKPGIAESCCKSYLYTEESCNWCAVHFDDDQSAPTIPPSTAAPAPTSSVTKAPTTSPPHSTTIEFDHAMSSTYTISPDRKYVEFTVTLLTEDAGPHWMGLGVQPDGKMEPSDVVVCSVDNHVKIHPMTSYAGPDGEGMDVDSATCVHEDDKVVLTFVQPVVPSGGSNPASTHLAISIEEGVETVFIYAHGKGAFVQYHDERGNLAYDLSSGLSNDAPTTSPPPPPASTTIEFDHAMSSTYTISPDRKYVEFAVTLLTEDAGPHWMGLGVQPDGKMEPSDVVVCSVDNHVKIHPMTSYAGPDGEGMDVDSATCVHEDDKVVLTFVQPVVPSGGSNPASTHLAISIEEGVETVFIYAHGKGAFVQYHDERGNLAYDLSSGLSNDAPTTSPPPSTTIEFDHAMSSTYTIFPDRKYVEFAVTLLTEDAGPHWMGLGVQPDGKMEPSDVVVCSVDNHVKIHPMTSYAGPDGEGMDVDSATCVHEDDKVVLTFVQPVVPSGGSNPASTHLAISIEEGVETVFIYAHGKGAFVQYHDERGNLAYDLSSGLSGEQLKLSAPSLLWLHAVFMLLGWGLLLPTGVLVARYFRLNERWYAMHRNIQTTGWIAQIIGYAMAVKYVNDNGGSHFLNDETRAHTLIGLVVFAIGLIQPLNAIIRPHKEEEGQPRNSWRMLWEVIHKGLGYCAVFLGAINVILGVLAAAAKDFEERFVWTTSTMCGIFLVFVVFFGAYGKIKSFKTATPRRHSPSPRVLGRLSHDVNHDRHYDPIYEAPSTPGSMASEPLIVSSASVKRVTFDV